MAGSPSNELRMLLTRDARLAALAKIDPENHPRAAGLSVKDWESVRRLCEAIELSTSNPEVEVLAAKCRWKRRNLFRIAALGRHAGILGSSPHYDEHGRAASRWWVNWDRLSVWAGMTGKLIGEIDVGECNAGGAHHAPDCTHRSIFAPTGREIAPTHYLEELNTKPSSSNPSARANSASEWGRLEEDLISCGVDQAAKALRIAREQGLSIEHVGELVAHWREHGGGEAFAAWGPQGLCWRIQNARPQLQVDRGWPKPSDAWFAHVVELERAKRAAIALAEYERNRAALVARATAPVAAIAADPKTENFMRLVRARGGSHE